jgi:hypothetical protein
MADELATLAGEVLIEKENVKDTLGGIATSEKRTEGTLASNTTAEKPTADTLAGIATAEMRTQATVAAKSTLENVVGGTNKTIAGIAEGQAYDFNFPEQTTLANTVAKNVTVIMRNASINRSNNNAQLQAVRTLIAIIDPDATSGATYAPQVVIDVIKSIYGI